MATFSNFKDQQCPLLLGSQAKSIDEIFYLPQNLILHSKSLMHAPRFPWLNIVLAQKGMYIQNG